MSETEPKSVRYSNYRPGALPGTLSIRKDALPSKVSVIAYGEINFLEKQLEDVGELAELLEKWPVVWVNVQGLGDEKTLKAIFEAFQIHGLAQEDVVDIPQRPKAEELEEKFFVIQRSAKWEKTIKTEQLSLFFSKKYVLSFQETHENTLGALGERIRHAKGRIRQSGADYLAYSIIDTILDNYFPVIESLSDTVQSLETKIVSSQNKKEVIRHIYTLKRELITLKRAVWPARDVLNSLLRSESDCISEETKVYLRDCYDHVIQNIELIETHRELVSGLLDLHLTGLSIKTNEVIQVLTVISTIFLPLTFIAGIYGMNFNTGISPWNLPELNWAYGYPFALSIMGATTGALLYYFRKKHWI